MTFSDLDGTEAALRAGGVAAIPTDTVYGLAVDPKVPGAVDRLFAVKGRPEELALPVLIADPTGIAELAKPTGAAAELASRYWPGPLTIVLERRADLSFELGGDPATIGLRCPASAMVRRLLRRTGPLAVTSANRHGEPPLHTAADVLERFGDEVNAVLDGGSCNGRPSTVVSLTGTSPRCLRAGAVPFEEIVSLLASL
jgi:tRNA threonylcarbamoyl adenosine modification protein (Sua5/YciO/YrdC/YwlC family)